MNLELRLLATMLKRGDFSPIISGRIGKDHFKSTSGIILFNFITQYRASTDNAARYPSLSVIRERFGNSETAAEIPDPDPGDTVEALSHELLVKGYRDQLLEVASEAERIASGSTDPRADATVLLARMRKITEVLHATDHASVAGSMRTVLEDYACGNILPDGIPWPWASLTAATKGMQKKEIVYFVGRPKARKTFTAMAAAVGAYKNHYQRVLVLSPEMPVRQMMLRTVATLCGLRYREFKDGTLPEGDVLRLIEAAETLGYLDGEDEEGYSLRLHGLFPDLPEEHCPSFDIVQSTGRDVAWIGSQIELYRPQLVFIDSLARHRADGAKRNDTDNKAISSLSREIKDLAMSSNVAVLATHHINRGASKELGGLENLSYADAFGQDADGIYRIVTGQMSLADDDKDKIDVSAILNYGGREVPFDGVLIKNMPCYDFSEIGPITHLSQVEKLMKQERAAEVSEENKGLQAAAADSEKGKSPEKRKPHASILTPNLRGRGGGALQKLQQGNDANVERMKEELDGSS